jgi:hypothetical protein
LEKTASYLSGFTSAAAADAAEKVINKLRLLLGRGSDLLGRRCRSILIDEGVEGSVLLVRNPRLREVVQETFLRTGVPVSVVIQSELGSLDVQETLVVVGQARFYDGSVLNSPRAERIWVVRYGWLRDKEVPRRLLPLVQTAQRVPHPEPREHKKVTKVDDFLSPRIDWTALRSRVANRERASDPTFQADPGDATKYRARLFLLAGGEAVYLESGGPVRVLVLNPEADGEDRVQPIPPRALSIGSVILLRRERGSGDFIEELADRLLGSDARPLRHSQQRWKSALRRKVFRTGVVAVENQLRHLGTRYQNVSYWMSPRSIRTRDRRDFLILMAYLGFESDADRIWEQMAAISAAHQAAGQLARRKLLEQVQEADLAILDRVGYLDFQLPDQEAGTLTAYRIEGRSPGVDEVAETLLNQPFQVAQESWLE